MRFLHPKTSSNGNERGDIYLAPIIGSAECRQSAAVFCSGKATERSVKQFKRAPGSVFIKAFTPAGTKARAGLLV